MILALLLSTTICKPLNGEENRDQEAEEDPATENFYLFLLQVLGTSVLLNTFANYFGMDCMIAMLVFAGWLYETLRRYRALQR